MPWIFNYSDSFKKALSIISMMLLKNKRLILLLNIFSHIIPLLLYFVIFLSYDKIFKLKLLNNQPNAYILGRIDELILGFQIHRLFVRHNHILLDFVAAVVYLIHFILPVLFIFYLVYKRKDKYHILKFIRTIGWVCLLGGLFQLCFPTSPPWYTDCSTLQKICTNKTEESCRKNYPELCVVQIEDYMTHEESAFYRIDQAINLKIFHSIYQGNKIKHGAFPSLHVAWPTVILFSSTPWFSINFAITHVILIIIAAIYTNHHYFIDCIGGFFLVLFVHLVNRIFDQIMKKKKMKEYEDDRCSLIKIPSSMIGVL